MLAMALSFNAASHFIIYNPEAYLANLVGWLTFSIIMLVALTVLIKIVKKVVLANINLAQEVEQQNNIGVATVELALSVAIALILTSLMA